MTHEYRRPSSPPISGGDHGHTNAGERGGLGTDGHGRHSSGAVRCQRPRQRLVRLSVGELGSTTTDLAALDRVPARV
jgi:hypothetical protein